MQQLEDDMDELFREAAAQYPLKTDGQDWNAVMNRLHQPGKAPATVIGEAKGKWFRRFWLLLLTPLFFIAHLPKLNMGTGSPHTLVNVTAAVSAPVLAKEKKTAPLKERPLATVKEETVAVTASKATLTTKKTITYEYNSNRFPMPGKAALPRVMPEESSNNNLLGAEDRSIAGSTGNAASHQPEIIVPVKEDSTTSTVEITPKETEAPDSTKPAEKEKKTGVTKKGFYAGIIVSPDLSTVKMQQTSKVGYGAGVVLGYRISKRLAVETGLLWDRKYYYTKGEYFDAKNIPSTWKINDVNGWCRMFEIPVQAHYFFSIKEKSSWYLNGGLSSYLMNREDYDYSYEWNGSMVTVNRSYNNATRNWFSIIHAGVGYERSLGILGTIRVEPYLKIPAGGIGLGSLPVTSFGLNMGITKSFR